MINLLPFGYALVLLLLIRRSTLFRPEGLPTWFSAAVFVLKLAAGTALWYIYTYYYTDRSTADIWKYFDDSAVLHRALSESPGDYLRMITGIGDDTPYIAEHYYKQMNYWYQQFDSPFFNDGRTLIRFNALLRLVSFGNYHVHTVLINFLALAGLCLLWRVVYPAMRAWRKVLLAVIFLLPSVLFWGSGVLKEGLLWLALGGLLWAVMHGSGRMIWVRVLVAVLCAWLLAATRLYVLAAVLPALGGWWLVRRLRMRGWLAGSISLGTTAALVLLLHGWPAADPLQLLATKRNDFINLARGGTYLYDSTRVVHLDAANRSALVKLTDSTARIRPGTPVRWWRIADNFMDTLTTANFRDSTVFHVLSDLPRAGTLTNQTYLKPEVMAVLRLLPRALFDCTLRPWPWEARHAPLLPSALETLLLIGFVGLVLFRYRRSPDAALAVFCVVFVLLLFTVTGLTTPVTGAVVRYKSLGLPFLFLLLLLHTDVQRFPEKLRNWLR